MKLNKIEEARDFVPAICEKHGVVQLTQENYEQGLEREDWRCPISGCGCKVVPQSRPGPTFRSK